MNNSDAVTVTQTTDVCPECENLVRMSYGKLTVTCPECGYWCTKVMWGVHKWVREFRVLPSEGKHLFVALALGLIVLYFLIMGTSKLSGRLEREAEINDALQRLSPQAVEAIRASCRGRWESNEDCWYFVAMREKRSR